VAAANKAAAQKLVTSLGAGSGVDVSALAQNLVDAERVPKENAINAKITKNESRISGYAAMSFVLSGVQTALTALKDQNNFWPEATKPFPVVTSKQINVGDFVYAIFTKTKEENHNGCYLGKAIHIETKGVRIHFVDSHLHAEHETADDQVYADFQAATTFYLARKLNQEQDQDQGTVRPCGAKIKEKGFGDRTTRYHARGSQASCRVSLYSKRGGSRRLP
jgi:hypothetical protein